MDAIELALHLGNCLTVSCLVWCGIHAYHGHSNKVRLCFCICTGGPDMDVCPVEASCLTVVSLSRKEEGPNTTCGEALQLLPTVF